jgi:hypothetical protein
MTNKSHKFVLGFFNLLESHSQCNYESVECAKFALLV